MKLRNFWKFSRTLLLICLLGNNVALQASIDKNKIYVTIDGGSATKKSVISQAIAEKFNFMYFETGALYRTVIEVLMRENIAPSIDNEEHVAEFLEHAKLEMYLDGRAVRFIVNDVCLAPRELRAGKINKNVAKYTSLFQSISDFCIKHAQDVINLEGFAEFDGIIVEGRTCGTYIFPDADLKFWLYATEEAKLEFRKNVEHEIDNPIKRDNLDFSRKFYPVIKPENAIEIWTSSRSMEENINIVSAFIEQKIDLKKQNK